MKINPKERLRDARGAGPEQMFGQPTAGTAYHTAEVATWNMVAAVANYGAENGWHVHTLRDGIRGGGSLDGFGYRILFERTSTRVP